MAFGSSAPRLLLVAPLLAAGLALAPQAAQAEWSSYSSAISEVDACNQTQYQMPDQATVQEFQLSSSQSGGQTTFVCKVRWSAQAGAQPTGRPILFPSPISIPLFAGGWL